MLWVIVDYLYLSSFQIFSCGWFLVSFCGWFLVLWLEKMHGMTSILNLFRCVLWPKMWSILENVPCALEKNVYSAVLGWGVLNISWNPCVQCVIQSHCFLVDFLFGWAVYWCKWGVKAPTIIVLLSITLCSLLTAFCIWVLSSWVHKWV